MSQIVVNGLLINYFQSSSVGQENGYTLLFLHGWRSQKEIWNHVAQRIRELENERVSVYTVDLPGFGQSQTPNKVLGVGDYASVVAEFIKKLELKNVIIIGHSFGGRIAIKLAATHPELINKLVLVDSAGFATISSKKIFYRIMAKIVKPLFSFAFMQGLRKKLYQFIGAEDYLATPRLQKTFVQVLNEDLSEKMKKITCPTLIIWGENDTETPIEFGQRMKSLIFNSKFTILPGAGHFSFLDQPEGFIEVLANLIKV